MTINFKNHFFWLAAFVSLILDRVTKYWLVQNFVYKETWALWPNVFHFTYELNPGAAFSWFQGEVWLPWLSLGVSLFLIGFALANPHLERWEQLGCGFILGGAVGNGIDRFFNSCVINDKFFNGCVVDFLDFRLIHFAVFNLADMFINVGMVCLLIAWFWNQPSSSGRPR